MYSYTNLGTIFHLNLVLLISLEFVLASVVKENFWG